MEEVLLKKFNYTERAIILVAVFFIFFAFKESSLPLIELFSGENVRNVFLVSDTSGLLFNVSCGAIATFIFWVVDILIPRHQEINRSRKYLPQWKVYLEAHIKELDSILTELGKEPNGLTRITLGSTNGITDSLDLGVTNFPKISPFKLVASLNAINTVINDIRKYEHSLNDEELKQVHELHMELIKYISFISTKTEIGSNKDFNDIGLIYKKTKLLLQTNVFLN